MSTNIRQLIKNINNGNNLDNNLPAYTAMLAGQFNSYALVQSMMQYYVICEQYDEGFFKEQEVIETVQFLHNMMEKLFMENEEGLSLLSELDAERTKVIRKMEVLTNYTDQLMVYEYMLNRIEHKFDQPETESVEDDTTFAQQILQYIFAMKDNYIVGERLKEVVGQLPVRMARSRFYELVKNSISLYKGGDKESLEGYLYMLRTCAMLYKPEAEGMYFADWGTFIDKLKEADFEMLDGDGYRALSTELYKRAEDIRAASEVFVSLQELINSLYVYLLSEPKMNADTTVMWQADRECCRTIIAEICQQRKLGHKQDSMEQLTEQLNMLEGIPEKIMMNIQQLLGCFQLAQESYETQLVQLKLKETFADFEKAQSLLSTSVFVEFNERSEQLVSDEMAAYETEKLLDEFSGMFHENSIRFVRAVIANVLSRMPVFFTSGEEISEYIKASLEQCKDKAEKVASYELLKELMEDEA